MDNQLLLEWLGYAASILVAISLVMSSIVKLRIYNLFGSALFSVYGFAIGAMPVGFINLFIFFINIYYLYKIYTEKEYFKVIKIGKDDQYLKAFLDFYLQEIKKFSPSFTGKFADDTFGFYILRNLVPAGIFIATQKDAETLLIDVDYAVPAYRDFKIGRYLYEDYRQHFVERGIKRLYTFTDEPKHVSYLKKMGFRHEKMEGKIALVKDI